MAKYFPVRCKTERRSSSEWADRSSCFQFWAFLRLLGQRKHSLSAESPAMRQDFVFRCSLICPIPSAAKPAAASPILPNPRPNIPGGTSTPSCPAAEFRAAEKLLRASTPRSAQYRKNDPPRRFRPVPLVLVRPAPGVSGRAPALLAASPRCLFASRQRKAPLANSILRAKFAPPQFHAFSPAATQSQTSPATSAHAGARQDASAQFLRRAPSGSARPILAPLRRAARFAAPASTTDSRVCPRTRHGRSKA